MTFTCLLPAPLFCINSFVGFRRGALSKILRKEFEGELEFRFVGEHPCPTVSLILIPIFNAQQFRCHFHRSIIALPYFPAGCSNFIEVIRSRHTFPGSFSGTAFFRRFVGAPIAYSVPYEFHFLWSSSGGD